MSEISKRFSSVGPVLLVGAGPVSADALQDALSVTESIVAADGGAAHLMRLGLRPDCVIGDFDSLSADTRQALDGVPLIEVAEQNTTDFEKCLLRIDAPEVVALGVTDGRLDHTLAAMSVLAARPGPPCVVVGGEDVIFAAPPLTRLDVAPGTRVSLYPMADVRGRSNGLRWPLDGLLLSPSGRVATSNRATGPVEIEIDGPCLVILPLTELAAARVAARG